jgi:hypothetical protein
MRPLKSRLCPQNQGHGARISMLALSSLKKTWSNPKKAQK